MAEILVAYDDRVVRYELKVFLNSEGFKIRLARNGEEALRKFAEKRPDLVLLGVTMPKMSGFRCCKEIRRMDRLIPILFLTENYSEGLEMRALDLGGDGLVSTSAVTTLLVASIRRSLARLKDMKGNAAGTIRLGDVVVDLKRLSVRKGGEELSRLTKTEADILACLNATPGDVVPLDDLIAETRGIGYACVDTAFYSHVSRLRTKLGKQGNRIVTVHGVGYLLT